MILVQRQTRCSMEYNSRPTNKTTHLPSLDLLQRCQNVQLNKSIFNKWCWFIWLSVCRRMKIERYLSPCTKLKSKWINDLNIKPDTPNQLEEKVGKSLEVIGRGGNFLNRTHALRTTIEKWDLMKLEGFCKAKDIVNKINQQPTDWEKNLH